ncbi:uncharacterized protein LOC131668848 [Phymastichus coffea]|uniref:uncharacterized protein LOC131668848 n=1 Tax=Phymastichus coffea TaxID=108790 RepID=UPI00273AFF89|nr:uncharacterized protein LOC131668848 [Phymastichus coffea]
MATCSSEPRLLWLLIGCSHERAPAFCFQTFHFHHRDDFALIERPLACLPRIMTHGWQALLVYFFLAAVFLATNIDGQLMGKEHRTHAASERKDDLWCYQCDTIDHGEMCVDVTHNHTSVIQKCKNDKRTCMVKRFSYTTSTENMTSQPMVWGYERNCTNKCEPGCIVIGERTKLYACTSCCDKSLCNTGNGTSNEFILKELEFILALILQIVLTFTLYPS